jgi:predicted NUDIX family NTP pyrophosphohydrolase
VAKKSAGILVYRNEKGTTEVFLVHPGGPFWQKKDEGAWSIPKGEFTPDEDPLSAARREFQEETGQSINGDFEKLTPAKQAGRKEVQVWAVKGNIDPTDLHSNTFSMEWPPRSGKMQRFPEVDRGAWFAFAVAEKKILKGQLEILRELELKLQQKKSG